MSVLRVMPGEHFSHFILRDSIYRWPNERPSNTSTQVDVSTINIRFQKLNRISLSQDFKYTFPEHIFCDHRLIMLLQQVNQLGLVFFCKCLAEFIGDFDFLIITINFRFLFNYTL